jgi:hypothetical protein
VIPEPCCRYCHRAGVPLRDGLCERCVPGAPVALGDVLERLEPAVAAKLSAYRRRTLA